MATVKCPAPFPEANVCFPSIADIGRDGHASAVLRRYRLLLVPVALLVGWLIRHFAGGRSVTVQTASFVVGGAAVLALLGVAFGFRSARESESRRKAKEDIWLNH